jgi:predicted transposase/invertase (TIGR01784 family)
VGVWEIDSNFCKVYLVELHKIDLRGLDRIYLGNFATDKAFLDLLLKTETTPKDSQESKWIDSIQNIIQDRIAAFEKDPEIRRKFMATVYEADITDLVKPHLDKAELRGELKGKIEGKLEGKLETARKMAEEGFSLDQIVRITGLTKEQVRENGIQPKFL